MSKDKKTKPSYKLNKGLIEKSNFVNKYEPQAFVKTVAQAEQRLKEMKAQKGVFDAKAENVRRNNPSVAKMNEEKRNAIWLYHENFVASKQVEEQIKILKRQIKDLKNEMKEIEAQTGKELFKDTPAPAPVQPNIPTILKR